MRVADLMTKLVLSVSSELDAEAAWREMRKARVHHLVVIDDGRIRGILSERDLGGVRGGSLREGRCVRELMTPSVLYASIDMSIRDAANVMRGYSIGCLPVLDGKTLVGMLTTTDLLELVGRDARRSPDEREHRILRDRGPNSRTFATASRKNGATRA